MGQAVQTALNHFVKHLSSLSPRRDCSPKIKRYFSRMLSYLEFYQLGGTHCSTVVLLLSCVCVVGVLTALTVVPWYICHCRVAQTNGIARWRYIFPLELWRSVGVGSVLISCHPPPRVLFVFVFVSLCAVFTRCRPVTSRSSACLFWSCFYAAASSQPEA